MQTVLITGANQGIGFATAKHFGKLGYRVLIGARNIQKGQAAAAEIKDAVAIELEVTSTESLEKAAARISKEFGQLDVLVNNAGIFPENPQSAAHKGSQFDLQVVKDTININYYGVRKSCSVFAPLMKPKGKIVNVSSGLGARKIIVDDKLRATFADANLTVEKLDELMAKFISDVSAGLEVANKAGWPKIEEVPFGGYSYGVSKIAVTSLTKILARDPALVAKGVLVNAVCPGWVQTNLGGQGAPRTVDQGAEGIVWAGTQDKLNGEFMRDKVIQEW